ncbi:MAG: hypothetical protein D4S01_06470 [Dehalococcoidia bacterium]|nr:MAG: hypothetical protein D4S01_06470 [Dehalococcoidia bacterium]
MSEESGSLIALANKLLSRGVPSLSVLIAEIASVEEYADFHRLIETFLPEREQEILHQSTPAAQIERFASFFEDRYFPLDDYLQSGEASYEEFVYHIPVIVMGISWDDYHEISSDWQPSSQLMTFLVENPHEEEPYASLAEACGEHVPQELLERVPPNILSPGEAHRLLDGTRYEALALWADRLHATTNNFFLDNDYDFLYNSIPPEWDMETVQILTRDWHQADEAENRLSDFAKWFEEDLRGHLEELLNFIEEKRAK